MLKIHNGTCRCRTIMKISNTYQQTTPVVVLSENDSQTIFDETSMQETHLFEPLTNHLNDPPAGTNGNKSSRSFTNNSQYIIDMHVGNWNHNFVETITPDGSTGNVLNSPGTNTGYGIFEYANNAPNPSNTYQQTIAYWIKFDESSDHDSMKAINNSSTWGGSLFHLGNDETSTASQIMIQFDPVNGYIRVYTIGAGAGNPYPTIIQKDTTLESNKWYLIALTVDEMDVKLHVNGEKYLEFNIEDVLVWAYNQALQTSYTTFTEIINGGYGTIWRNKLANIGRHIVFIRDITSPYFAFDLWKIYAFDRILSDAEHNGLYQNPI